MKKTLMKLSAAALLALIALVVVVMSTFAWYSVSDTPEVSGMRFNIGGSNTIRIAADMTQITEDGVLHYPGRFSDSLNFSRVSSYDYLKNVVSLTPVSTGDGIHWFFPGDGTENLADPFSGYLMDDRYVYANLSELPTDDSVHGSYIMMDFWVMSPMDCHLRLSCGDDENGTYAVSLPYPTKEENGRYSLVTPDNMLTACVRVGFLADTRVLRNESMDAYAASAVFDDEVHLLKGVYGESGEKWDYHSSQFTIYEPNADIHNGEHIYSETVDGAVYRECVDGSYVKTYPIGYVDGQAKPVDVTTQTTVQTTTRWLQEGESLLVQQLFETFMLGESVDTDSHTLFNKFCSQYLGYRCDPYIDRGKFVQHTAALSNANTDDGMVTADDFRRLRTANATEDVVIVELQRNIPQRIRMFVWVEGQDVDCSNVIAASGLMINLELAGSSR